MNQGGITIFLMGPKMIRADGGTLQSGPENGKTEPELFQTWK